MALTRVHRIRLALVTVVATASLLTVASCRANQTPPQAGSGNSVPSPVAGSPTKPAASPAAPPQAGGGSKPTAAPSTSPAKPAPLPVNLSKAPPALGVQFHGVWEMYWNSGGATPNSMFWRHLDELAKYHVSMLRVDIGWSSSQPTNAPPTMNNTHNKRIATILKAAADRKMKVLLTMHQSPNWARPGTGDEAKQLPTNPDSIRPWATWLARTFGKQVEGFEVWNEPNLTAFTQISDPRKRAARYVPLLKAAAQGLRAGDPSVTVVFGGPAQTDDLFIKDAYAAGAKPYFDVMAIHPYQGNETIPPESTDSVGKWRMTNFPAIVKLMADNGDSKKPVWWTEFGFSVHSNTGVTQQWMMGVPTATISGDYLRRSLELARTRYPQVRVAIVYVAYKPYSAANNGQQFGYRLLESNGKPLAQLPMLGGYMAKFSGAVRPLH